MIKKNKKGMLPLRFLVGLILIILLMVGMMPFIWKLARVLTPEGAQGFEDLVDMMKEVADPNSDVSLNSVTIDLDKGTLIAGFDKSVDKLHFLFEKIGFGDRYLKKPSFCSEEKSCICRCTDVDFRELDTYCKEASCVDVDFNLADYKNNAVDTTFAPVTNEVMINTVEGGFLFGRDLAIRKMFGIAGSSGQKVVSQRTKNIRVQRVVNDDGTLEIAVCDYLNEHGKCVGYEEVGYDVVLYTDRYDASCSLRGTSIPDNTVVKKVNYPKEKCEEVIKTLKENNEKTKLAYNSASKDAYVVCDAKDIGETYKSLGLTEAFKCFPKEEESKCKGTYRKYYVFSEDGLNELGLSHKDRVKYLENSCNSFAISMIS